MREESISWENFPYDEKYDKDFYEMYLDIQKILKKNFRNFPSKKIPGMTYKIIKNYIRNYEKYFHINFYRNAD